jgi:hypothetical protein
MNLTQVCTLERPPLLLKAQTAADLMTPNPVSLREEVTAREAARFLTDRSFSAPPQSSTRPGNLSASLVRL